MDNTDINNIFLTRLRSALKAKEGIWSQRKIAAHFNIRPNTVNCWFTGKNFPGLDMVNQLAEILDVSPQWLFGAEEADKSKDRLIIELIEKAQSIRTITGLQAALEALDAIREGESLARQETLSSEKKKA